jgi:hypothetical protein|tara:strand:- start:687 stop:935 length:249 start_codon:yes stop_codon:yes gene_type:complete
MAVFTDLEVKVLSNLKDVLVETESVYLADLIQHDDNAKKMRGAISSLIKKNAIDVDYDYPSNINGTVHYPVTYWDEDALKTI